MSSTTNQLIGPNPYIAAAISQISYYNVLVSGLLSVVLNSLLIFIFMAKLGNSTKIYKFVMVSSTMTEILFSIYSIRTSPLLITIKSTFDFNALLIVNSGSFFSFTISQFELMFSIFLMTQLIFIPPELYINRYLHVCKQRAFIKDVVFITIINTILLLLTSGLLCFASLPTSEDIEFIAPMAYSLNKNQTAAFMLISYKKKTETSSQFLLFLSSIISGVSYLFCLLISVFIMIYCTIRMNLKVGGSSQMSYNLNKLQTKMNIVLISQFISVLIFVQIPFFYSVLAPIVGLSNEAVSYTLSLLFPWAPVSNAMLIFLLSSETRKALIGKNSGQTPVVRVSDRGKK